MATIEAVFQLLLLVLLAILQPVSSWCLSSFPINVNVRRAPSRSRSGRGSRSSGSSGSGGSSRSSSSSRSSRSRSGTILTAGVHLDEDQRPHGARATFPRPARRVNHGFKYLYRHIPLEPEDEDEDINITALAYLSKYANLAMNELMEMNSIFPPLLSLDVKRHLHPKLMFLQRTLGIHSLNQIHPSFFGARLERIVAPRHAFMLHHGVIESNYFANNPHQLQSFLVACKSSQIFAAYCNQHLIHNSSYSSQTNTNNYIPLQPIQVEAWDIIFQRGLLTACRMEADTSWTNTFYKNSTSSFIQQLLLHGANPNETDSRGATLLHWACGSGNVDALQSLLALRQNDAVGPIAERDGATLMHWAVAGATARDFGTGGHLETCRVLLQHSTQPKQMVNSITKDGNSVLMWAVWAGTLPVVKWLIRNRATAFGCNRNGCTVAHWAASGGSLETCRYLKNVVGVDFTTQNYAGNTPLTHAVAFGRLSVVQWLRDEVLKDNNDAAAFELAHDFVQWTGGDDNRNQVLSLFQTWLED